MRSVVIITNAFPFLPGEQFLEDEIKFWGNAAEKCGAKVTIFPLSGKGKTRPLPPSIEVNCALAERNISTQWLNLLYSLYSATLWKEIIYAFKKSKISLPVALRIISTTARFISTRKNLKKLLSENIIESDSIFYCYWNEYGAYAVASLKISGQIKGKLFSRCHGYDLYESRRIGEHMPLKRQFLSAFEKIFPVSQSGANYFSDTYNYPVEKISVCRLGVETAHELAPIPSDNGINIISIGSIIEVKRIDRIVDIIYGLAKKCPTKKIYWTHAGSGSLQSEIETYAQKKIGLLPNVEYKFCGSLKKNEVISLLSNNPWDFCLNTSASEGVPVSLMEAMSFGIPTIAPKIGGIPELLGSNAGTLLPAGDECVNKAISTIMSDMAKYREKNTRLRARARILESYDASKNYNSFIEMLTEKY